MSEPSEVRIRMYNAGFGDCFLLTFTYPDLPSHHVLIDFGTMGLPRRGRDGGRLHGSSKIADQIVTACGNEGLTAVVATHRHQDHISGFAGSSGEKIAGLKPRLVLQPWTERDPAHPEYVRGRGIRKRFAAMNADLEATLVDHGLLFVAGAHHGTEFLDDDFDYERLETTVRRYSALARGVAENGIRDIVFLGNLNIKNEDAVKRLATMAPNEYLGFGDRTNLEHHLPGVRVHVLGPPTTDRAELGSPHSTHAREFWHLARSSWGLGQSGLALGDQSTIRFEAREEPTPIECRWLASHINHARPRDLLAIVRDLDDDLNNTSLILLFEIWSGDDRRLLLFSGDAQLEGWSPCLEDPVVAALLTDVDVYKVGHHGSLNATPKTGLWQRLRKRGDDGPLVTLLSTCNGRHGHRENHTEVPRWKLVVALRNQSHLIDTRRLADTENPLFVDCVVQRSTIVFPVQGVGGPTTGKADS